MSFLQQLGRVTNMTATENGAATNKSSLDPVVDFFSRAGAMRDNPAGAADLFERAYIADPQTALRVLFYLRDVRGGQGEREVFRAGLRRLARLAKSESLRDSEFISAQWFRDRILYHVPFYGRWDDIFFDGASGPVVSLVQEQLASDLIAFDEGDHVSLMAKWLPSENTTSRKTRALATQLRVQLGYSPAEYRRHLSRLRARIGLLEHDMSGGNWSGINYATLPGQAHRKHIKAFRRHDGDRYQAYLDSVTRGEAKINVSTLYPYEIYDLVRQGQAATANVMWENLPDYTNGVDALVMADVSGSMYGMPMSVSVSLALYFAERSKGAFAGHFLTFSSDPQLVKVIGSTLEQRMSMIERAEWGQTTDLGKAFRAILHAAIASGGKPPKVLYVVSDMEFDAATSKVFGRRGYQTFGRPQPQDTVFATARAEFAEVGLELPHVVFWNVNARNMQSPATVLDGQVTLVSGCSPTVFGMAVEGKSPRQLVDDVVNSERYERIVLP